MKHRRPFKYPANIQAALKYLRSDLAAPPDREDMRCLLRLHYGAQSAVVAELALHADWLVREAAMRHPNLPRDSEVIIAAQRLSGFPASTVPGVDTAPHEKTLYRLIAA